jgi:hypothetical protein
MVSEETREKMRRSQQLRRMKKPAAVALREGDMVVCPDGTIGLLSELRAIGLSQVQFGAAGPFRRFSWKNLRRAAPVEIEDEGLHGVGCNQMDEPGWRR